MKKIIELINEELKEAEHEFEKLELQEKAIKDLKKSEADRIDMLHYLLDAIREEEG